MSKRFYFDTGVRRENGGTLFGRQVWRNGTLQIPFTCNDVPGNTTFLFACDNADLAEAKNQDVIVREIVDNGPDGILSKFAYFRINEAAKATQTLEDWSE